MEWYVGKQELYTSICFPCGERQRTAIGVLFSTSAFEDAAGSLWSHETHCVNIFPSPPTPKGPYSLLICESASALLWMPSVALLAHPQRLQMHPLFNTASPPMLQCPKITSRVFEFKDLTSCQQWSTTEWAQLSCWFREDVRKEGLSRQFGHFDGYS